MVRIFLELRLFFENLLRVGILAAWDINFVFATTLAFA